MPLMITLIIIWMMVLMMWQWWKCDNDVPEDYTDYHLNYGDGDGDDYWNDDDGDKWKVLCWLSSYCPLLSETFPQQCLWCWTMWVVMSPCWHWVWSWWWTHQAHYQPRTSFPFMMIEYHLRDPPYHVCSEQHWPLMNIPIKWNITRISSFRRNLASCQKSFPFQINIKKRYYVDQLSATNKHFRNERLDKKCPQRCKKNWSPEKGVSHQEWQEVSDPSVMPSFYQLTTEGKPCQRSRCQHTVFLTVPP